MASPLIETGFNSDKEHFSVLLTYAEQPPAYDALSNDPDDDTIA